MKNKLRLIVGFFWGSLFFPTPCLAQFDNSIGFGVQYAGVFGWQGSWTEDNIHARIALGLVGATAGIDVSIDKHVSFGATFGAFFIAEQRSFNLNYYPGGQYTQGWRVGLDVGTFKTNVFGEEKESFTGISFGYSFK